MRSTYSLPTWMIEQVNNKKENTPVAENHNVPIIRKTKGWRRSDVIKKANIASR